MSACPLLLWPAANESGRDSLELTEWVEWVTERLLPSKDPRDERVMACLLELTESVVEGTPSTSAKDPRDASVSDVIVGIICIEG